MFQIRSRPFRQSPPVAIVGLLAALSLLWQSEGTVRGSSNLIRDLQEPPLIMGQKVVRGSSTISTSDNASTSNNRRLFFAKQKLSDFRDGPGAPTMRTMMSTKSKGTTSSTSDEETTSSTSCEEIMAPTSCEEENDGAPLTSRYYNAALNGAPNPAGGNEINCDIVLEADVDCSMMAEGSNTQCIIMNCDHDCTLDCNGYSIIGPGDSATDRSRGAGGTRGISIVNNDYGVTIKNCIIREFDQCIYANDSASEPAKYYNAVERTRDTRPSQAGQPASSPSISPIPAGEPVPIWVGGRESTGTYSECPTYDYLGDPNTREMDSNRISQAEGKELFDTNQCCPGRDAPGGPLIDGFTRLEHTVLQQCFNGIFATRAIVELNDVVATNNYYGIWIQVCSLARIEDIYFCGNGPGSGVGDCSTNPNENCDGDDVRYQGTGGFDGNSVYFQEASGNITFTNFRRNGLDTFPIEDVENNGGNHRECPDPDAPLGDAICMELT